MISGIIRPCRLSSATDKRFGIIIVSSLTCTFTPRKYFYILNHFVDGDGLRMYIFKKEYFSNSDNANFAANYVQVISLAAHGVPSVLSESEKCE